MILCCGEALIDMLPRTTAAGEGAFAPHAGGAVFNTAIAMGRLGAPAGFLSGLSSDLFGQILEASLAESSVSSELCIRSDRPTTLAFVTLVDGQASYAFYDENTAGRMIAPADLPPVPDEVSTLFFGGISLVVEPCGSTYEALMQQVSATKVTMLDPNIRPGFIKDEASYRARIDRMISMADIIKVSDEDLAWIMGDGETANMANAMRDKGPELVFVTEGAKGVTAYHEGGATFRASDRVDVVDTVGAGDTFNAGVLTALHEAGVLTKSTLSAGIGSDAVTQALALGARSAAVTVSRAGANPPRRDEL